MIGTLQVDVDDLWVYYESIGLRAPEDVRPLAFAQGIPRLLDLFDRYGIRVTFFVCGRDLPEKGTSLQAEVVQEAVRRGHEIANHSLVHRNGFARLSTPEKRADIVAAGERIAHFMGQLPVGFKAPGFSFGPDLPGVLAELGYLYDSSLLPTPYAPFMRLTQRLLSRGRVDGTHYGRVATGFAPLRPFRIVDFGMRNVGVLRKGIPHSAFRIPHSLWEVPVTTLPIFRLPMHSTFVLSTGRWLFDLGLALAQARRVPINYLLHAADVVDAVGDPTLASYRFLTQSWNQKRPVYEHILAGLSAAYRLVPTQELIAKDSRDPC
jgi:hypothetical protein